MQNKEKARLRKNNNYEKTIFTEKDLCFCRQYQFTPIFLVENGKCYVYIEARPRDTFTNMEQNIYLCFANEKELDTLLSIIKKY